MRNFSLNEIYSAPAELEEDCSTSPPAGAGGYSYLALSEPFVITVGVQKIF